MCEAAQKQIADLKEQIRVLTETTRVLTCAYCGQAYPPGTPESNHEALSAHIQVCEKHPLRAAEAEIAKLTKIKARTEQFLYELTHGYMSGWSKDTDAALARDRLLEVVSPVDHGRGPGGAL